MVNKELDLRNIGILNKTLMAGIKEGREEYKEVIKKNLNILLKNLDVEQEISRDQIIELEKTMKLIKSLLSLKVYPNKDFMKLLKRSWINLGAFIMKVSKRILNYTIPKGSFEYNGKKYPYPFKFFKEYSRTHNENAVLKKIFEWYLPRVRDNLSSYMERYTQLSDEPYGEDELSELEKIAFNETMSYYLCEGLTLPYFLKREDVLMHGINKLIYDLDKDTQIVVKKVKNAPEETLVQLNRERDLDEFFEMVSTKLFANEKKLRNRELIRYE